MSWRLHEISDPIVTPATYRDFWRQLNKYKAEVFRHGNYDGHFDLWIRDIENLVIYIFTGDEALRQSSKFFLL